MSKQFILLDIPKVEQYWHEDCLKCGCCNCRLGEVSADQKVFDFEELKYLLIDGLLCHFNNI